MATTIRSRLPHTVQQMVQDLPFKGFSLFSEQTDSKLHSLKDSWAIQKSLGLHTSALSRRHFKPQPLPRFYPPQSRQDYSRRRGRSYSRRLLPSFYLPRCLAPTDNCRGPNRHFEGRPEGGIPGQCPDPFSPIFVDQFFHFFWAWTHITSDR